MGGRGCSENLRLRFCVSFVFKERIVVIVGFGVDVVRLEFSFFSGERFSVFIDIFRVVFLRR